MTASLKYRGAYKKNGDPKVPVLSQEAFDQPALTTMLSTPQLSSYTDCCVGFEVLIVNVIPPLHGLTPLKVML
jgi:hypothetical protein